MLQFNVWQDALDGRLVFGLPKSTFLIPAAAVELGNSRGGIFSDITYQAHKKSTDTIL